MNLKPEQRRLLALLLIADLAFLILHVLYLNTELLPAGDFSLSRDRSYAEFFQYTKELWLALLCLRLGWRPGTRVFAVFSGLFTYFLIDDSLRLHENLGAFLADTLALPELAGLRAVDLGELAVYGYFALLFSIGIGLAYFRSEERLRRPAKTVILLVAGLAFFGVLMDMLAIAAPTPWLSELLDTIEDFGEMAVMSALTAFAFGLEWGPPAPPQAVESMPGEAPPGPASQA